MSNKPEISEQERKFLIGLERLTRETGIQIAGCGCCGSPFLEEADCESESAGYGIGYAGEVCWMCPSEKYNWEKYAESIVKDDAA